MERGSLMNRKRGTTEPMRRVAKEEARTWVLVAVVALLWVGVHAWG